MTFFFSGGMFLVCWLIICFCVFLFSGSPDLQKPLTGHLHEESWESLKSLPRDEAFCWVVVIRWKSLRVFGHSDGCVFCFLFFGGGIGVMVLGVLFRSCQGSCILSTAEGSLGVVWLCTFVVVLAIIDGEKTVRRLPRQQQSRVTFVLFESREKRNRPAVC